MSHHIKVLMRLLENPLKLAIDYHFFSQPAGTMEKKKIFHPHKRVRSNQTHLCQNTLINHNFPPCLFDRSHAGTAAHTDQNMFLLNWLNFNQCMAISTQKLYGQLKIVLNMHRSLSGGGGKRSVNIVSTRLGTRSCQESGASVYEINY